MKRRPLAGGERDELTAPFGAVNVSFFKGVPSCFT